MDKKKIFLWGTGHVASEIMMQYGGYIFDEYEVLGWIDSNSSKHGRYFYDKMIYPPIVLRENEYDYLIILVDSNEEICRLAEHVYKCNKEKIKNKLFFCLDMLLARYSNTQDDEINEVLDYIKKRGLHIFNYEFMDEYENLQINVCWDSTCEMFYVYHDSKKMYFKKSFRNEKDVRSYYSNLLAEQDKRSPHCYVDDDFKLDEDSIVVDAGAAEGIFSLCYIDKISKLYIVETDAEWCEALQQTFKPYKDKVIFVKKFLCDINLGGYTTLDDVVKEPVDFIKMDIESYEVDALRGAKKLVTSSNNLKCSICCYHTDYDEDVIKEILDKYGMKYDVTPGYMWFPYLTKNRFMSDRLHRGVIRASKCD